MKRLFIIALLTSVAMAMGQKSNFCDYVGSRSELSLKEVTGNSQGAYELMHYASAQIVAKLMCVANVNTDDVYMRYNATEATISINTSDAIQRVELFDLQGRAVYAADANMTTLYRFSVADCPAGVYICKVYTAAGTAVQKFVVR